MLKEIDIKNFRNLKDVKIEPALITLLIGANDSGKSGIFHSLLVLKQTFHTDFRPSGFSFVGRLINLGSRKEVVYEHEVDNVIEIGITSTFDAGTPTALVNSSQGEFAYKGISKRDRSHCSMNVKIDGLNCEYISQSSTAPESVKTTLNETDVEFNVSNRGSLGFDGNFIHEDMRRYERFFSTELVKRHLENFYFVPVPRGIGEFKTELLNVKADELITSSGTAEITKNLLSLVSYDIDLVDEISRFMERLFGKKIRPAAIPSDLGQLPIGLTSEISTYSLGMNVPTPSGTVDFYGRDIRAYAANTGFGLNQILFLFAQVLDCPNGSTVMVEEPEISLHPLAQKELMELLIDIAKKQNKQFIISTHSEHIAFAVYGAKDHGKLSVSELAVYHFEKQKKSTPSIVTRIDSMEGSLRSFLGNDPTLILQYVDAFGKHKQWVETGTVND